MMGNIAVIYGPPDGDKYIIARAYADSFLKKGGDVIWMNSATEETFTEDLIKLSFVPYRWSTSNRQDENLHQILSFFCLRDSLFIFNNAVPNNGFFNFDLKDIEKNCRSKVLITSDSSNWESPKYNCIEVDEYADTKYQKPAALMKEIEELKKFRSRNFGRLKPAPKKYEKKAEELPNPKDARKKETIDKLLNGQMTFPEAQKLGLIF